MLATKPVDYNGSSAAEESFYRTARFNMIQQQIRPWQVLDDRILNLLEQLPREHFVPIEYKKFAYSDLTLPLPHQQSMLEPRVEARIVQCAELGPHDKVLHIGTGSGYVAALIGRLTQHTVSWEIYPEVAEFAENNLQKNGVKNVVVRIGNGITQSRDTAPYDKIILTGSVPELPSNLDRLVKENGSIIAIVGTQPIMTVVKVKYSAEGEKHTIDFFQTYAPPFDGLPSRRPFVF